MDEDPIDQLMPRPIRTIQFCRLTALIFSIRIGRRPRTWHPHFFDCLASDLSRGSACIFDTLNHTHQPIPGFPVVGFPHPWTGIFYRVQQQPHAQRKLPRCRNISLPQRYLAIISILTSYVLFCRFISPEPLTIDRLLSYSSNVEIAIQSFLYRRPWTCGDKIKPARTNS